MTGNVSELTRDIFWSGNHLVFEVRGGHFGADINDSAMKAYHANNTYILFYSGFSTLQLSSGFRLVK